MEYERRGIGKKGGWVQAEKVRKRREGREERKRREGREERKRREGR